MKDIELAKRYPLLLAEMLRPTEAPHGCSLGQFGLQCGPGWRPLLEELFAKLEAEIAAQPETERHGYRAVQIKEKFGALRVYLDEYGTPAMVAAIQAAQKASATICDVCSEPGVLLNRRGVLTTRCERHVNTQSEW